MTKTFLSIKKLIWGVLTKGLCQLYLDIGRENDLSKLVQSFGGEFAGFPVGMCNIVVEFCVQMIEFADESVILRKYSDVDGTGSSGSVLMFVSPVSFCTVFEPAESAHICTFSVFLIKFGILGDGDRSTIAATLVEVISAGNV